MSIVWNIRLHILGPVTPDNRGQAGTTRYKASLLIML